MRVGKFAHPNSAFNTAVCEDCGRPGCLCGGVLMAVEQFGAGVARLCGGCRKQRGWTLPDWGRNSALADPIPYGAEVVS